MTLSASLNRAGKPPKRPNVQQEAAPAWPSPTVPSSTTGISAVTGPRQLRSARASAGPSTSSPGSVSGTSRRRSSDWMVKKYPSVDEEPEGFSSTGSLLPSSAVVGSAALGGNITGSGTAYRSARGYNGLTDGENDVGKRNEAMYNPKVQLLSLFIYFYFRPPHQMILFACRNLFRMQWRSKLLYGRT